MLIISMTRGRGRLINASLNNGFARQLSSSSVNDVEFPESGWPKRLETAYLANPSANSKLFSNDNNRSPSFHPSSSSSKSAIKTRENRNCFVCNQPGHFATNCEQKNQPKCFNCGQMGHFSKECTQARKPLSCFYCKQPGHMANSCPKKSRAMRDDDNNGRNNNSRIICYYCKAPGHISKNCPLIPMNHSNTNTTNDNYDLNHDHDGDESSLNSSPIQRKRSIICFKCKQPGHLSVECPA